MYRQPARTNNQSIGLEPTFCSALIHKIGWKSPKQDDKEKESKMSKNKKTKTEDKSSKGKDKPEKNEGTKKQREKNMKYITKKLKKITSTLPLALRSSDAYEKGVKGCETCTMEREEYKKWMQTMKVIEIAVDGIIEKEQSDLIDKEKESEDIKHYDSRQKTASNKDSPRGNGDRVTLKCEVYREKKLTKHNLKCLLIKLQKMLGDVLVQISFVKTRKLSNEERYKKFDVSVGDLKQLRFEYTNLTDKIISLFKKPSAKKTSDTEICITCVKEKLTDLNNRLEEGLKSGRNLKLVMRNLSSDRSEQCCSRTYPHIHAEVQGKPLVLKYSQPLQKDPGKYDKDYDHDEVSESEPDIHDFNQDRDDDPSVWPEKSLEQKSKPYDEWPSESSGDEDAKSKQSPLSKTPPQQPKREKLSDENFRDSESDDNNDKKKKTTPFDRRPNESSAVEDAKSKQSPLNKSSPKQPTREKPNDNPTDAVVDDGKLNVEAQQKPDKKMEDSQSFESSDTASQESFDTGSLQGKPQKKMDVQQKPDNKMEAQQKPGKKMEDSLSLDSVSQESFDSGSLQGKPQKKMDVQQKPGNKMEAQQKPGKKMEDSMSLDSVSQESFDSGSLEGKAETKVDVLQKPDDKMEAQQKPGKKMKDSMSLDSWASDSQTSFETDSLDNAYEQNKKKATKKVSFNDKQNATVINMIVNETNPQFPTHPLKGEYSSSPNEKDQQDKGRNETSTTNKTPFGSDLHDVPIYIAATDSLILAKHRLSHVGSAIEKQSILQEDGVKPQSRQITHHNKKVEEVLNMLGNDRLLSVSTPADCCFVNNLSTDQSSFTDLPLKASLYSLPLDQNDLNHIVQLVGEHISLEDITLMSEKYIPIEEYEWEKSKENEETKWLRSLAGVENPSDHLISSNYSVSSEKGTRAKCTSLRVPSVRNGPTTLPTIAEETPISNDKIFNMPYIPSIPSLPLDEEEKKKLLEKKRQRSILKNRVTELRYFTVEFWNKPEIKKTQFFRGKKSKSAPHTSFQSTDPNPDKDFKKNETNLLSKEDNQEQTSCESFQSCHSTGSLDNTRLYTERRKTNYPLEHPAEESVSQAVDEMIMMNVIYMCGAEVKERHAKGTCKFSNSSNTNVQNKSSYHILGSFTKCSLDSKASYTLTSEYHKKEINNEDHNIFLKTNKTLDQIQKTRNQSYTIIKNPKENNDILIQNHPASNKESSESNFKLTKTNKSYTIIKNCNEILRNSNMPSIKHIIKNSRLKSPEKKSYTIIRKDPEINRNNHENKVKNSTCDSSLKFKPTSLNPMKTIFKGETKILKTDRNSLHLYPNKPNNTNLSNIKTLSKRSYTIIKNREKQINHCNEKTIKNYVKELNVGQFSSTQQKPWTSVDEQPKPVFGVHKVVNICRSRVNWSKLNIQNLNVKNYIMLQSAQKKDKVHSKDTSHKIYHNLKRKPLILKNSKLECVRVECKIAMPMLKFTILKPIYVRDEVPQILYNRNQPLQQIYKSELSNVRIGTDSFISTSKNLDSDTKEIEAVSFSQDFGIEKEYTKVKNISHPMNTTKTSEKQIKPTICHKNEQITDNNFSLLKISDCTSPELLIKDSTNKEESKGELVRIFCGSDKRNGLANAPSSTSCLSRISRSSEFYLNSTNEYYLIDHNFKPLHLFDINGRPVTDNSGRPLRNIKGNLLVKCTEVGIPVSDAENHPIFDTFGHSLYDYDFNPIKPQTTEVLKNFTTDTGEPLLLYDTEGRPLTSASGTMLLDCSGKSLIRFNCTGKPVSDLRGKPIFDLYGRIIDD